MGALKSWLSCFPEKQLLLLRYDLLKEKPRAILTQSSHHIGVDPGFFESISDATLSQRVFSGEGEKIRPSLYPVLVQLYERQIDSRSEEHTSELQSHSFISYAVFRLQKKTKQISR